MRRKPAPALSPPWPRASAPLWRGARRARPPSASPAGRARRRLRSAPPSPVWSTANKDVLGFVIDIRALPDAIFKYVFGFSFGIRMENEMHT